jgi:hypothetical protein
MGGSTDYVEVFHASDGWRWERKNAATHAVVVCSPTAFTEHRWALESASLQNPDASAFIDIDHPIARR